MVNHLVIQEQNKSTRESNEKDSYDQNQFYHNEKDILDQSEKVAKCPSEIENKIFRPVCYLN